MKNLKFKNNNPKKMLTLSVTATGLLVLFDKETGIIIPVDGTVEFFRTPIFTPSIKIKMDLHLN